MKKVCMIVPKGLPLPAVRGGAIETIITNIIKQNEIEKRLDLTVVSLYDEKAMEVSKIYKYTKFIYVKKNLSYYLKSLIVHIKNYMGKDLNTYNEVVLDKIKHDDYDYVIVEDGAYWSFKSYLKYFPKNKMVLHFHHVEKGNIKSKDIYGSFIGVSQFAVDKFKTGVNVDRSIVLQNCIDVSKFNKKVSTSEITKIKEKYGFSKDDFVVLFCGRLIKEKGILELIKAVNNCNDKIKLLVVGSANFGDNVVDDFVQKLKENSSDKIKFTGYIDNSELYKFYKISNLVAITTIIEEAAPLTVLEAMTCGTKILTTGTGGVREYLNDNGIYVSNDDNLVKNLTLEIEKFYYNPVSLDKTVIKNTVLNYDISNYYNNLVDLLNSFNREC